MKKNNKQKTFNSFNDFRPLKEFEEQIENSFKRREDLLSRISRKKRSSLAIVKNDSKTIDEEKVTKPKRLKVTA